ncbi:MAG: hypothetical protein CME40_03160 [Haliea sp.]|nr:hypothetical protein [Haliea sp.]
MGKRTAKALTIHDVTRAKPQEKPYELRDATQPGLLLRVQPSGAKSWVVVYLVAGKKTRKVLGNADKMTLRRARTLAKSASATAEEGTDPYAEEKTARSTRFGKYLEGAYTEYAEQHIISHKDLLRRLKRNWGHLADRPMTEITPMDVQRWRRKKASSDKPVSFETLQRELTYLKACLTTAIKVHRLIPSHQLQGFTLTRDTKQLQAKKQTGPRYLSPAEETALREALAARENEIREARERMRAWQKARGKPLAPEIDPAGYVDHLQPIVLLALNTGLRRGDLLTLEWGHVDFNNRQIRKVINKTRRKNHALAPSVLPLSNEAMQALRKWNDQHGKPAAGLVFPSPVTGGPMDNIKKAWEGLVERAGLEDFRFHDLRHTFASRLVMAGVPLNTVRELMTHSDIKMTLVYAHLSPSHKEDAIRQVFGGEA